VRRSGTRKFLPEGKAPRKQQEVACHGRGSFVHSRLAGGMKNSTEVILRPRPCLSCGRIFSICRSCERGQRYCGVPCRRRARLRQRRAANRRHQQSPEGRLDHRDRQRSYRARLRVGVTDHRRRPAAGCVRVRLGPASTPWWALEPGSRSPIDVFPVSCARCGRSSRRFDPFDWG
jgi:hypothetical protein